MGTHQLSIPRTRYVEDCCSPAWNVSTASLRTLLEAGEGAYVCALLGDLARGPFQRELWYAAQNLYGDAGSADADLTVLGFDYADGIAETIVRARRGHVEDARAALACIDAVGGDPVGVRVRFGECILRSLSISNLV